MFLRICGTNIRQGSAGLLWVQWFPYWQSDRGCRGSRVRPAIALRASPSGRSSFGRSQLGLPHSMAVSGRTIYMTAQGSKGECPKRTEQKLYYLLGLIQSHGVTSLLRENCQSHIVRRAHGMGDTVLTVSGK